MYDPTVGRFITLDPIGFHGTDTNTGRYCRNSPTNLVDPSGKAPILDPNPLEDGAIALFFGHYVPPLKEVENPKHRIAASAYAGQDHINQALNTLHRKHAQKAVPDYAYIAGIGCFPEELKAKVEQLFGEDKWLPGVTVATPDEYGRTTEDQDVQLAYDYFQKAVAQAKRWITDKPHLETVTITIYIDGDFLKAVRQRYAPNSNFRKACESSRGTVINKHNVNKDFSG